MLTCITCSKQKDDEESERGSPRAKDSVKSLTCQLKDILKLPGGHRHEKRAQTTSFPDFGHRSYFDAASSSSTPARVDQTRLHDVVLDDSNVQKEWMAQVEPGVNITFISRPNGGNDLKRIRFSRELFDKWEARRWWGENQDRIMELYNVQRFNQQALQTPARSENDQRESSASRFFVATGGSPATSPPGGRTYSKGYSAAEAARATTSSRDDVVSVSNASDVDPEWVVEDEPGVFLTIRQVDGNRELRRIRFSEKRFGVGDAKLWWEHNRERIEDEYLS